MIKQRYGNNINLHITVDPSAMAGGKLEGREIVAKVRCQFGKRLPFDYTVDGNTIKGTLLGMNQPTRPDVLSIELHLDKGTPTQQVINISNVIRLVSDSSEANIALSQTAVITTYGNCFTSSVIDTPKAAPTTRRVKYVPATAATVSGSSAVGVPTPDVILS